MNYNAGKRLRIKRHQDIARLFQQGQRVTGELLTLIAAPNGLGFSRAATAVSSRHGGAVRRNRIKRLCREAFRLTRKELPAGWDFVLMPRRGADLTTAGLQENLRILAARLNPETPRRYGP